MPPLHFKPSWLRYNSVDGHCTTIGYELLKGEIVQIQAFDEPAPLFTVHPDRTDRKTIHPAIRLLKRNYRFSQA